MGTQALDLCCPATFHKYNHCLHARLSPQCFPVNYVMLKTAPRGFLSHRLLLIGDLMDGVECSWLSDCCCMLHGKDLIFHAASCHVTSRGGAERVILFETLCYLFLPSPGEHGGAWHAGWHTGTLGEQNPPADLVLPPSGRLRSQHSRPSKGKRLSLNLLMTCYYGCPCSASSLVFLPFW